MNDNKLDQVIKKLNSIKKLLVLLLQQQDVKAEYIAKTLGVTKGRISQMAPLKQYKKRTGDSNG